MSSLSVSVTSRLSASDNLAELFAYSVVFCLFVFTFFLIVPLKKDRKPFCGFIVAIVAVLLDLVITLVNTIGSYLIDMTVKTTKKAQSGNKTEFSITQSPKVRNIDNKIMADCNTQKAKPQKSKVKM